MTTEQQGLFLRQYQTFTYHFVERLNRPVDMAAIVSFLSAICSSCSKRNSCRRSYPKPTGKMLPYDNNYDVSMRGTELGCEGCLLSTHMFIAQDSLEQFAK